MTKSGQKNHLFFVASYIIYVILAGQKRYQALCVLHAAYCRPMKRFVWVELYVCATDLCLQISVTDKQLQNTMCILFYQFFSLPFYQGRIARPYLVTSRRGGGPFRAGGSCVM